MSSKVTLFTEDVLPWLSEFLYASGFVATAKTLEEEIPIYKDDDDDDERSRGKKKRIEINSDE
eukprot:m.65367 g.65367  ORF g.65367 m.65367 type:complete len:63 (-) comp11527_c3_seq4:170-358(-)